MTNKSTLGSKPLLFLRKILAHYPELTFSVPHKIIADNFSMPPSTVSKYLKLLVESRFVIQEKVDDIFKDKGVAKYRYQISEAGVKLVNSFAPTNSAHQELIAQIQSDDFKTNLKELYETHTLPEEDKRYAVNTDDCVLLLEILLNQANKYGVVLGLTRSNLSNIVGFKVAKIQRLTKILRSLGLITQVTPGLSGFFGIQPSTYQLSLNHSLYAIEQQSPIISINLKYAEKLKLPADHLIGKIQYLKKVDIKKNNGSDDSERYEALENLKKLHVHLTAPKYKMISYCNSLMSTFAAQVLSEIDEFDKLIAILKGDRVKDENEIKANIISQFKEFLDLTILSSTKNINDLDNVVRTLLPFFLENILYLGLLILEMKKPGYRKLLIINSTIESLLREPKVKLTATFGSKTPTEGVECNNYNALLHQSRRSQQLEVRLEPVLKGLI